MAEFRMDRVVWGDMALYGVEYGFAPSKAAYDRALREIDADPDATTYPKTYGCCVQFAGSRGKHKPTCVVTIHEDADDWYRDEPWLIHAMIAHEATHVWQFILDTVGEQRPGEEMTAHAVQHITAELIEGYMRTRGRFRARKAA